MPTSEEASFWPTENLLHQAGRKHYRSAVSPIHWQLRSLLSAERDNILYFPAGVNNTHIQRLDTSTRECETIKVISFHPRCLVVSKGNICCGGENGEFVIIRESGGSSEAQTDSLSRDFRSRLNNLESSNISEGPMYQLQRDMLSVVERINGSNKTWSASSHKIGTERVNCITIWHPPKGTGTLTPGQYDTSVAIVSNNDKTITVIGLDEPESTKDVLDYPDCVNRGVISPDGSLLIAICDDPYLYIHKRQSFTQHQHGTPRESFKWTRLPRIRLKGQWSRDTTECRGSFAACFSSSGKYLAVGTQYGTISVFDAVALKDPDSEALITYFDSDRAPGQCGAVRDMAFCPGPYDLLAWSEHRGRIGVADARSNFKRRQIIPLSGNDSFHHYSLNDSSTIDPRLLDPRSERDAESSHDNEHTDRSTVSLLERLGRTLFDRPLPNPESSSTSRINQPFSADEVAVLEAFQSDRRRRETRERNEQSEPRPADHRSQRATERNAWRSPNMAERVSDHPVHNESVHDESARGGPSRDELPRNGTFHRDTRARSLSPRPRRLFDRYTTVFDLDMYPEYRAAFEFLSRDEEEHEFYHLVLGEAESEIDAMMRVLHLDRERPNLLRDELLPGAEALMINLHNAQSATLTRIIERERLRESRDRHRSGLSRTPPEQEGERGTFSANARQSMSIMQSLAQNVDSLSHIMNDGRRGNESNNDDSTPRDRASSPWYTGRFGSGWADIDNLATLYGGDRIPPENTRAESNRPRRGIPVITDVWANDSLFTRIRTGSREHHQNPDDTAGLTWSEDGRTLYAAAEDGIYELQVNMQSRMLFPDIQLR
ncbi:hypothetical protein M426DRAFT_10531 [Hypoxylon sp. CI-4A]|nr:hypothetical protein M426DRAFT_10531 [Hypoxylon sp. CI-4A]